MTPDSSWKSKIDQLSSAWIDGADDEDHSVAASDLPCLQETIAQHYLADLLLVDALLSQMADGADKQRELRIRRVMDAIERSSVDPPVLAPRPRVPLLRRLLIAASAACVLLAFTLFSLQFARDSLADDVLLAVDQATARETDRVYAIRQARGASGEVVASQAKLYLRGRSGFVIKCAQGVLGRDGDRFWLVDSQQQVTVSEDFRSIDTRLNQDELGLRFLHELSLESRHIPLMQLASVAQLMQHDYVVTLSRSRYGEHDADLLIGQRRHARSGLPATIHLWADVDTRIIQRAELRWEQEYVLILDLLPDESVPRQWYGYQTHCHPDSAVRRIPLVR
jgi:hypothetical protein